MNITSFHANTELGIEHQQMLPLECYPKGSILWKWLESQVA